MRLLTFLSLLTIQSLNLLIYYWKILRRVEDPAYTGRCRNPFLEVRLKPTVTNDRSAPHMN